jgi:hypothetical protein
MSHHHRTLGPIERRPIPTHEEIATLAYEVWERSHEKPGRDLTNWLWAEFVLSRSVESEGRPH